MRAQANVNLHNRFDIEVRDAVTGELKQKAQAENIVLNQMWTRLCGGSSYFVNIHFGTGTGTLAPTRTSLFTHLGTKTPSDVELVKAIPNSSWKRAIVLNPEENVGAVLTEVGIAYGATSTNLVTHAMIEDSEGNPISITKGATDLVTIYATVFVTFSPSDNPDLKFISMPDNNTLVNYLIGGGTAPTGTFRLGSGGTEGEITDTGCETLELGATATATWTSDTANKQRKTAAMRFGATVGNGHVKEFVFPNVFRARLPLSGVFAGQPYEAVPIGTGDGSTKEFTLPSLNIRQASITMKLDGTVISTYTKTLQRVLKNPDTNYFSATTAGADYCLMSRDGKRAAILSSSGSITFLEKIGTTWKACRPTLSIGAARFAVNDDFTKIIAGYGSGTYLKGYIYTDGAWVEGGLDGLPTNVVPTALGMSDDGSVLAIGTNGSPYIYTYDLVDSEWIERPTPPSFQNSTAYNVTLSEYGDSFAVKQLNTVTATALVYDWTGTNYTLRATPSGMPGGALGEEVEFSRDGTQLLVVHDTAPYVKVYDWIASEWVERPSLPEAPASKPDYAVINSENDILVYGLDAGASGVVIAWHWDGVKWDYKSEVNVPTTAGVNWLSLSENVLGVAYGSGLSTTTRFSTISLDSSQTKITFDTAPAAGVAITGDYTVDGVHKTDQYVIDVGLTIQFGEPT